MLRQSLQSSVAALGLCQRASSQFVPVLSQLARPWQLPERARENECTPSGSRAFSTEEAKPADGAPVGNPKVQKIAEEILGLTVLEASWLTDILRKKLNMQKPAFGAMPMMGMMGGVGAPAAAAPAAAAAAPAAEEKKKEKTEFDVKLESFSAEGKIKVIKEIRTITNLGLKEAKELVEKAPVVIKASVAKADAENFKKLIEAAGGKVSLA